MRAVEQNDDDIPVAAMIAPSPYPHHQRQYPVQQPHSPYPQPQQQQRQQVYAAPSQMLQAQAVMVPSPVPAPMLVTRHTQSRVVIRTTLRSRPAEPEVRVVARQSTDQKFQVCSALVFSFGWCIPILWIAGFCMVCVPKQTSAARCLNTASSVLFTIVLLVAIAMVLLFVVYNYNPFGDSTCDSSAWIDYDKPCFTNEACLYDMCEPCPMGLQTCADWATEGSDSFYSCVVWC